MTQVKIRNLTGTYSIRAGGAVIGESTRALELNETGHDPVIYFPRDDIAMAFLDRSASQTTCPHKGNASYFSIVTKSTVLKDAAWSYEQPIAEAAQIKDYLAFYDREDVTVEAI